MRTPFHRVVRHAAVAAALLLAGPVAAQVIQHCVVVTTCRTVESEIFGWVYKTEEVCQKDVICHYHVGT